jgi:hypothetical protein
MFPDAHVIGKHDCMLFRPFAAKLCEAFGKEGKTLWNFGSATKI